RAPHLCAILVGNDGASETYVANKVKNCDATGISSTLIRMDSEIRENVLLEKIQEINRDPGIDGLIVQLPLPGHIRVSGITSAIDPKKDVDGFHPVNVGRMTQNLPCYLPATPYGILLLLERYNIKTSGMHCVVVGRSQIVGLPMSILLSRNAEPGNCTVTLCHSRTKEIASYIQQADLVIAALGKPGFVTGEMVREGAIVIDVGITRVPSPESKNGFRLQGDVDFESVSQKCSYITPVPGGVGKMTIIGLLKNTLNAARGLVYS
ncbi:MAG: bifunctional 5,10-methylene-tetrahydrofolate dehydrogenase/5,10-methylene-tetrahydrofolate cyclohydrolase, partial [Bacteroidia bacterium]|nr:bifunctional 5,10-methylene-tetrahydrofolate dehydrogenase/5,10-methylene-tetrahydrofolate cyclohydrolase [Bacteroidia bacterium]